MMSKSSSEIAPRWMSITLWLAAGYNIVWGAWVVAFPLSAFRLLQMPLPNYPQIWQCVGMIVGVYGIGYACAALNPVRHWPVVLVGWLGKLFGPLGFFMAVWKGELPLRFGVLLLLNDFIWWIPFTLILLHALRQHRIPSELPTEQTPSSSGR
jgi:small multidrug resistance pump